MLRLHEMSTFDLYRIGTHVQINLESPDITQAAAKDLTQFLTIINSELTRRDHTTVKSILPK